MAINVIFMGEALKEIQAWATAKGMDEKCLNHVLNSCEKDLTVATGYLTVARGGENLNFEIFLEQARQNGVKA
ncbi:MULTISPECIES: hypothetical protein [Nitrosomonas]|uniref:Uncharacterized protein n=1 Tax=Nitrosomonas communis TaxID=44574 RepID=A0A0F7KH92_9PROT|nr:MULTISPECIES: hypothetical protein [Nitrosomonas]AKH38217.1 hypothetical protein AAW31_11145 [Nitrosomonas communis]TYP80677.1 hypothetical protein BCL69_105523 [Nitrosomonas communis]UVS60191.1 hypothetical protein NX761_11770 [Nitrosomonas sp. PLL12]